MVALGRETDNRALERARESLGKREARQLESPTKHRAKPESRQHDGSLSPTKRERSRRVCTAKRRSQDLFDC